MTRYASNTEVSSDKSRNEIERTLIRYGAGQFAYGWDETSAVIGFVARNRQVKFVLPLPDKTSRDFALTPTGKKRAPTEVERVYEQAVRQRWRALALVIKAKLEACEAGIVTFDDEFAMHMVLPDGRQVREVVVPEIEHAYQTGNVRRAFLAIGPSA